MAEKAASNKEHPLAGVILCFTSILPEQRTELASIAGQMGATHKLDLTSDVTHLLVGEINTPKYKFVARERPDVVVLKPEWVEAVRQSWIQGGDTDKRALEQQYKLPTFDGLSICITGFEDMVFRNYIRNEAILHGAEFKKDLTKTVTHLIARSPEGEKYKVATQWNVKVVTFQWFSESIERGMILEETLYHPLLPPEQQGAGAWNRSSPEAREKPQENESSANPRPRKLRRIASTKLVDQNEGIWDDIVGIGVETWDSKRPKKSQHTPDEGKPKDASAIQIAKSFASETTFAAPSQPPEQPAEPTVNRRNGFLDDCFFFIHGFSSKQANVLRDHLSFNGAHLVDSLSEFSRADIPKRGYGLYIIVPYKTPRSGVPSTDDLAFECEVVTDMWLERCLDAKALVSPESHLANTPIPSFPLNGFSGIKICSTGFSRIDLLHLSKLVNLVGATYNEYLTPIASVLICNDATTINHDKLRHTQEWGVPAVTVDWLWTSIRQEKKQPFEPYFIRRQSTPSSKDLEVRAGSRLEQKQPEEHNHKNNTTLRQSTSVSNKSQTPDIDSAEGRARKQAIIESPRKESTTDQKPTSESQQQPTPPTQPLSKTEAKPPSTKRKFPDQSTASTTKSAIDSAVKGLLKASTSRSASNTAGELHRSRRPRPLLGRAQSNPSARATEQKALSRASSIDTLNEDGCGSAVESVDTGIRSLANSGRFEFDYQYPEGEHPNNDGVEQEPPPMTQLDYEDPDAVAMREKFLRYAGKIVERPANKQQLVIGEVKELEQTGWGAGRRTRNANKVVNDVNDDDF